MAKLAGSVRRNIQHIQEALSHTEGHQRLYLRDAGFPYHGDDLTRQNQADAIFACIWNVDRQGVNGSME